MTVQDLIATAIETELNLGGDPKSCASLVVQTLADEGYQVLASPTMPCGVPS